MTVQVLEVPGAKLDGAQEIAAKAGTAEPLKFIENVPFVEELLTMASWPVTDPSVEGENCTVRVVVSPGLRVKGKVNPEIEKPAPLTEAESITTGAVPVELRVTPCVADVPTVTVLKLRLLGLTLSVCATVFNCRAKVSTIPPALAVMVAVCELLKEATVTEKAALAAPAGTVMVAGRVTVGLLLARFATKPPPAAAALSVTVQVLLPAPLIVAFVQESPFKVGTPVPLRLMEVEAPVEELLAMSS